jgi:hypothetical protein
MRILLKSRIASRQNLPTVGVRGHKIWYAADAVIDRLKASGGGSRAHGSLLETTSPSHAVGTCYFALRTMRPLKLLRTMLWQPIRAVITRHHLRKPWWIVPSFVAEIRGILLAVKLNRNGAKLISAQSSS